MNSNEVMVLLDKARYNPGAMFEVGIDMLEKANNGELIFVDASQPAVQLIEMAATLSASAMHESAANTRRQFARMALDEEELYLHMSDKDYIGRWATPARTTITVAMALEEVLARAVPTGVNGVQKMVIPRNTEFTVAGVTFSMQYPIEIRINSAGTERVVYDVSRPSPLMPLSTNLLKTWKSNQQGGIEMLFIEIPVMQMKVSTSNFTVSRATPTSGAISFAGSYYATRAYHRSGDGPWEEILTTETKQVFDPAQPTVSLQVFSDRVLYSVPEVYATAGTIKRQLRLDVYSTEGDLSMILSNYESDAFDYRWQDFDNDDNGLYWSALENITTMLIFSDEVVTGGSEAKTFEELREQVMMNAHGASNQPITPWQIISTLTNEGYSSVKTVDNLTRRIYKTSRPLPLPADGSVLSPIGAGIMTFQQSLDGLKGYNGVKDNGERVTLTPEILYKLDNGLTKIVEEDELTMIRSTILETQARLINTERYLFSPYHYVLDITGNVFEARGYYLDNPSIDSRNFIAENDTLGMTISTDSFDIERTEKGYRITVVTASSEEALALPDASVHAQLCFQPTGESGRAYLNGTLEVKMETGERAFVFELESNLDINSNDDIYLTNFQMFGGSTRPVPASLTESFDLIYVLSDYRPVDALTTDIDLIIAKEMLPEDAIALTHEKFNTNLGSSLDGLWTASRSVVSDEDFKKYSADVPWLYEEPEFERDPNTGTILYDIVDGEIKYRMLHAKGEVRLDDEGKPLIRFPKGDVMRDADGNPIVESTRKMQRQVDLFFLDGKYWFATNPTSIEYRDTTAQTVVRWLSTDISAIRAKLLEGTELYFAPQTTLGNVQVMVEEGLISTIPAEQGMRVGLYLGRAEYADARLRESLTRSIKLVIADRLIQSVVSIDDITDKLREEIGSEAIAFSVSGLGGANNFPVITTLDDTLRCSVRKRVVAKSDDTLAVEDDVQIDPLRHTLAK